MIIAHNNIKIESSYVQEVLSNPLDYDSIKIDININCCESDCEELIDTYTLPVSIAGWYVDLDSPVKLGNSLARLNFVSLQSYHEINSITSLIDLGYVEDNCSQANCTLQTYSAHFAPLLKSQIDAFFLSIGITTDVVITFTDNTMKITGVPDGFMPSSTETGTAAPYTKTYFGYSEPTSKAFVSSNSIYIKPDFFSSGAFINGVYKTTITFYKADKAGYIREETCGFIDIDMACKVAAHLKTVHTNQLSTNAHLLHYALINGSNCNCNCDDLCKVFTELVTILNSTDQTSDCGC